MFGVLGANTMFSEYKGNLLFTHNSLMYEPFCSARQN